MNLPPEVITAAARAYCLHRYDYRGTYGPFGREAHITADAASVAGEPWLVAALEAAATLMAAAERARFAEQIRLHGECDRCCSQWMFADLLAG